ncbi:unnamed protein product [Amaranthus hypochondriacus]
MGIFGEQLVWWELKTEEMDRIVAGVPSKKAIKQLAASGRIFVEPFVKIRKYPQFQLFNCFQIVYFFIELGDIKWPYPTAPVEMAPTSTGKSVDLGQNPSYEGPRHKAGNGPANYFIRPQWSATLDKDLSLIKTKWALPDGYSLVKPRAKESVLDVPEGCIAIYKDAMETGLRFPLHPFAVEVLNAYNITVSELYPNGWGCMVAFIIVCSAVGVEPTLTAFRYIFQMRRCSSKQGPGWVSFQHRSGFLIVDKLKDSMKRFRNDFVFLYRAEPWPFRTSHDEQPNLNYNNNVPQCDFDEFLVIEHATKGLELGEFKPSFVQRNFVVDRAHLQNDLLLSAL